MQKTSVINEFPYIVVSGNMGTGKTTLINLMSYHLDCRILNEPVLDNPYIEDYYRDMGKWAFHYQHYFLGYRANQLLKLGSQSDLILSDRCVYEDADVFANGLHKDSMISDRDYKAYRMTYEVIEKCLPKPKLLIYLHAPAEVLMNRIASRNISSEINGVGITYLQRFNERYENWISEFNLCPVLRVNTEINNFLVDGKFVKSIAEEVKKAIGNIKEVKHERCAQTRLP